MLEQYGSVCVLKAHEYGFKINGSSLINDCLEDLCKVI